MTLRDLEMSRRYSNSSILRKQLDMLFSSNC